MGGRSRPGSAPEIEIGRREPNEALIKETRELLREEEKDKKELRKLRRKLEPYADTTVSALLLDPVIPANAEARADTAIHPRSRRIEYARVRERPAQGSCRRDNGRRT